MATITQNQNMIQPENSDRWAYDISQKVISKGEIYDVTVINQSIENILMTTLGERIFNITFGSNLMLKVFELATLEAGKNLLNEIVKTVERWEDRIKIDKTTMNMVIDVDNNSILIELPYSIKNSSLSSVFKKKIINS